MILIQIILIVAFLALLFRFLLNPSSYQIKAGSKLFMLLFIVLAITIIIFPNSLNTIAHRLGVTRGADLLLYMLTLAFIFVVFHLYVRGRQDQKRLVSLVRKVALLDAELRYGIINKAAQKNKK